MTGRSKHNAAIRAGGLRRARGKKVGRWKTDSVLDVLGQEIVTGRFAPGDRLPTENELGRLLDISRPTLREGLKALSLKGLVEPRKRQGTTVAARSRWQLLDADVLRWMSEGPPDREFFAALLEVRAIIEPAATRIAAERATPEQIAEIEACCDGMAASLPDNDEAWCRHDLNLHEAIIAATGNALLMCLVTAIRTTLMGAFRLSVNARESYVNSLAEHRAVAEAIARRDPDAAERAMRLLLAGTARDTAPAFGQRTTTNKKRKPSKQRATKEETDASKSSAT